MLYRALLRPLLWQLDAEQAHGLAAVCLVWLSRLAPLRALAAALTRGSTADARLATPCFGQRLPNPIGLAAGFDKNGEMVRGLHALGFGFVEAGTLTPLAQPGNPKPRLFRLPADRALINRLGFNNAGSEKATRALGRVRSGIFGVNVGKNKVTEHAQATEDYVRAMGTLEGLGHYVVVNISSPNTPGLRRLQSANSLREMLATLKAARGARDTRPLWVKVAPDLSDADFDEVIGVCCEAGVSGLILANTTVSRDELETPRPRVEQCGAGGLSGAPLKRRSLEMLRRAYAQAGDRLELISVGGVETAEDVWERLSAGARAVQLYTALVYAGPGLPKTLCRELLQRLDAEGLPNLEALIGRDARPLAA